MADVSAHYDGSAPTYHEQYDPDLIWKNAEYPANYFRLQKVIEILHKRGATSVYDLGAGEASPIYRAFAKPWALMSARAICLRKWCDLARKTWSSTTWIRTG